MASALESAAIELGNKLLPLLEDLVGFITGLAQGFANLNPGTQKFILAVGALAAAIGPLLILVGQMSIGLSALVPLLPAIGAALASVTAFVSAFAVPLALAAATIYIFNRALTKNKRRLEEVTEAQNKATQAAKDHISALDEEAGKLSDDELKQRIAELKAEQKEAGKSVSIIDDRVAALARNAEIDAVALQNSKKRTEITAEGTVVQKEATEEDQRAGEVAAELSALTAELTRRTEDKRKKDQAAAKAAREKAEADRVAAEAAAEAARIARLEQDLKVGEDLGLAPEDLNITGLFDALDAMAGGVAERTRAAVFQTQAEFKKAMDASQQSLEEFEAKVQRLAQIGSVVGDAFGRGVASIITGSKKGKEAVLEMVGTMVSGALRASQANIIAAMTNAGIASGPAAPFVIPTLVASGIALVEGLFSALPALASGGLTTGPTLALIGDNPSGKEAVIPFERMGQFLNMAGAGSQHVTVAGRLQGMDILLSHDRAALARNRNT